MRVFLAGEDTAEEANFSEIRLQLGEGRLLIVGEEHSVDFPPHLVQILIGYLREQFCPQSMKM